MGVRNALARVLASGSKDGRAAEPQSAQSKMGSGFWSDFRRNAGKGRPKSDWQAGEGVAPLNILVPFDFTSSSNAALDCAMRMARNGKAKITLLHAVNINLSPYGPANLALIKKDLRRTARAHLSVAAAMAEQQNIAIDPAIQDGKPCKVIEQFIRENEVDLVIIGRHWHRRLGWFVGQNVAEKVVRCARCPVLVLQDDERATL